MAQECLAASNLNQCLLTSISLFCYYNSFSQLSILLYNQTHHMNVQLPVGQATAVVTILHSKPFRIIIMVCFLLSERRKACNSSVLNALQTLLPFF